MTDEHVSLAVPDAKSGRGVSHSIVREPIGIVADIWRGESRIRASGFADRDLSGQGAAMAVRIDDYEIGGIYATSSEVVPVKSVEMNIIRAKLISVTVTAIPLYACARFDDVTDERVGSTLPCS